MSNCDCIRCRRLRSMGVLFVAACMTATSVAVGGVPAAGLVEPTRAAAQDGPVTVEATGRGESPKEARKEAIVAALRKVVGEYVEAEVEIADDEVVRNEILSFSNAGGVKSEQVGDARVVGDFVEVTMRVTVEPKPLVQRIRAVNETSVRIDGAALAAEIERARDDFEAKKRVLEKAFAELPSSMITVDVLDAAGQPTDRLDRGLVRGESVGSRVRLTVPIRLSLDVNVWNDSVRPALDRVMTAAANRTMRTSLTLQGLQGSPISVDGSEPRGKSTSSSSGKRLAVGDQAPTLRGAASVQGPLNEVPRGRVGVVLFWATWCGPCKKSLPILARLHEDHRDDGLAVIGVSGEKAEVVSRFLRSERASIPFSVLADADGVLSSRWMKASGRRGIPCVFLVSSGGEVAWMGHPADPGLSGRVHDLLESAEPQTSRQGTSVMISEASRRIAGAVPSPSAARIALLNEVLRSGRQMVFDEFELDPLLLPWSERGGLDMVPPMVVRVRLRDAQGEVVDGADLDLAVSTPSGVRFGWRRVGWSDSVNDPGPWPLYAEAQPEWFASDRGSAEGVSTTIVWPFWFSDGLVGASIETEVELEVDRRDLERVATIEVDLASQ